MPRIYCFGNDAIEMDSMAVKVGRILGAKHCSTPEEMFEDESGPMAIIDVVQGTKEVMKLKVSDLSHQNLISLHDFDLAYFLKLMVELGKVDEDEITIIGIPMEGDEEKISEKVRAVLRAN